MSKTSIAREIYKRYYAERMKMEKVLKKVLSNTSVVFAEQHPDSDMDYDGDIRVLGISAVESKDILGRELKAVSENVYYDTSDDVVYDTEGVMRYYLKGEKGIFVALTYKDGCETVQKIDSLIIRAFEALHKRVADYEKQLEGLCDELEKRLNLDVKRIEGIKYTRELLLIEDYESDAGEESGYQDEYDGYSEYVRRWRCGDGKYIEYMVTGDIGNGLPENNGMPENNEMSENNGIKDSSNTNEKHILKKILMEYFAVGVDCYSYNLTRTKSAFAVGTVGIEDFEEFDEEFIDSMVESIENALEDAGFEMVKKEFKEE